LKHHGYCYQHVWIGGIGRFDDDDDTSSIIPETFYPLIDDRLGRLFDNLLVPIMVA
jgi:hypothetical protein